MSRIVLIAAESRTLVNFRGSLMCTLRDHGHDVHALGPAPDEATRAWFEHERIAFHPYPVGRSGLSPRQDIATYRALRGLLAALKPDTVLTYTIKPTVYGIPAAWFSGVKNRYALITGLGYAFIERDRSLRWRLINLAARALYATSLRMACGVLFQNEDDLALFRALGLVPAGKKTAVVNGSGVDINHFVPAPLPGAPVFLMIARLLRDKGIGEYIQAARIIRQRHRDAQFHLVGPEDPSPAAFPLSEVEAAVADKMLTYHGPAGDVRPHIAQTRIFVLPSYREGTPRAVLEAMAMGRASIVTDVPGCRAAVIPGRNGLLVPAGDAQALAAAMETLINQPDRAASMGEEARRMAEEIYDVRLVNQQMLEFMGVV